MPDANKALSTFQSIREKLADAASCLCCATITIAQTDAHTEDDDLSRAEMVLCRVMAEIEQISTELGEFERDHLAPRIRAA